MTKLFKYSVLKYVHSQFLGEELNLGIAVLFPDQNRLIFRSSRKINRLKKIYKTFADSTIKEYLSSFEQKAEVLSKAKLSEHLEDILKDNFLVKDASPLQFDQVKSVVQYSEDIEKIADQYFQLYFPDEFPLDSGIELSLEHIKPLTDHQIAISYKNLLVRQDKYIKKYLKPAIEIRNEKAHFKSDLAWQNGTINAVKGVSFDLRDASAIADKALLINAKLNYLKTEASAKNIRFDLLVTTPKIKELHKAYDNALQILNDINTNKQIITEDKLEDYTLHTLAEVER